MPENITTKGNIIYFQDRIWIPPNDAELKLRIILISHCGASGHRGKKATESMIRENFIWDSLEDDVSNFVNHCFHCITTREGDKIPRPLASTLHGSRPNEVLHMDYLFMGNSIPLDFNYILILRDDFSSFVWLFPTNSATS